MWTIIPTDCVDGGVNLGYGCKYSLKSLKWYTHGRYYFYIVGREGRKYSYEL